MDDGRVRYFKYAPNGFVHVWVKAGWRAMPEVLSGTSHGDYSTYMEWVGDGEPICPRIGDDAGDASDRVAAVAVITGDLPGDRYITLGEGDGTSHRWKLTEELARKIRRELNQRLD